MSRRLAEDGIAEGAGFLADQGTADLTHHVSFLSAPDIGVAAGGIAGAIVTTGIHLAFEHEARREPQISAGATDFILNNFWQPGNGQFRDEVNAALRLSGRRRERAIERAARLGGWDPDQ